eukprot:381312-Pyramimonas_sp.AAC.1
MDLPACQVAELVAALPDATNCCFLLDYDGTLTTERGCSLAIPPSAEVRVLLLRVLLLCHAPPEVPCQRLRYHVAGGGALGGEGVTIMSRSAGGPLPAVRLFCRRRRRPRRRYCNSNAVIGAII